jgi:hypothetical protein
MHIPYTCANRSSEDNTQKNEKDDKCSCSMKPDRVLACHR